MATLYQAFYNALFCARSICFIEVFVPVLVFKPFSSSYLRTLVEEGTESKGDYFAKLR